MHGYNLEKSAIRHSQSQRTKGKGGKKRQPKSWWARPSSPGFSAWCKVIPPPWEPVRLSEETDKSQRP